MSYKRKVQVKKISNTVLLSCISKIYSNKTEYEVELVKVIENDLEEVLVEYRQLKTPEEANAKYKKIINDIKTKIVDIS